MFNLVTVVNCAFNQCIFVIYSSIKFLPKVQLIHDFFFIMHFLASATYSTKNTIIDLIIEKSADLSTITTSSNPPEGHGEDNGPSLVVYDKAIFSQVKRLVLQQLCFA